MELITDFKTYKTALFLKLINQKKYILISLFVYIDTIIDNADTIDNENNYKDFFIGA